MRVQIDNLVELLRDGKWHTMKEISQKTNLHEFRLEILTRFLADYSFLELDIKERKARLSKSFAQFLRKTQP